MSTELNEKKPPRLMVVVPAGDVTWKEGELEKGIEELVTKAPCLHISREVSDYHMDRVRILDPETVGLLQSVFPNCKVDEPGKAVSDQVREYNAGVRHVCGLIDLTLKLRLKHPGCNINWQYPEQLLHPAQTLKLTDCVMKMLDVIEKREGKQPPTIEVETTGDE